MSNKRLSAILRAVALLGFLAVVIGGLFVATTEIVRSERERQQLRALQEAGGRASSVGLRREVETLKVELSTLKEDLDICHARVSDVWGALEAVAKTVPWRARPPRIPERKRPAREQTTPIHEQEDPNALPDAGAAGR